MMTVQPYHRSLFSHGGFLALALGFAQFGFSQNDAAFQQWLQDDQAAFQHYRVEVTREYEQFVKEEQEAFNAFVTAAADEWGKQNVWIPERKVWVQYTEDLQERSAVDFEVGMGRAAIIVEPGTSDEQTAALLEQAVQRVALSGTEDPITMMRRLLRMPRSHPQPAVARTQPPPNVSPTPATPAAAPYTVQGGDTLWGLSKRFGVSRQVIAAANGIDNDL